MRRACNSTYWLMSVRSYVCVVPTFLYARYTGARGGYICIIVNEEIKCAQNALTLKIKILPYLGLAFVTFSHQSIVIKVLQYNHCFGLQKQCKQTR